MTKDDPEPVERWQKKRFNPADQTFSALHDREIAKKQELTDERQQLLSLMEKMPIKAPKKGSREYLEYATLQEDVQRLKEKISKKHNELMEILKNEEKISREIQEKNF